MQSLAAERQKVERDLAGPNLVPNERVRSMRRHAELAAQIQQAEAAWLAAEEALQAVSAPS